MEDTDRSPVQDGTTSATEEPSISTRMESASPTTQAKYSTSETPRSATFARVSSDQNHGHGRSMSSMDSSRKSKRFSMTFPINTNGTTASRTPSPIRTTYTSPMNLPESVASPTGPTDSSFLTAIAAQERRALELKEELYKTEVELKRLKQEWALHEATRKRHDARRLQKLQPLSTQPTPSFHRFDDDPDGSSAWMQQEMERRKALLNGSKTSTRTVFSGSRHARTLSLLSPSMPIGKPTPQREIETRTRSPTAPERPTHPPRLTTDEVMTTEVAETVDMNIDLGLPRDVLMKTGKQMATDFRDGLWTFIEDLRQATVGDEGINGTTTRTQSQYSISTDQRSLRQQPSRGSLRPLARPQALKRSSTTNSTTSKRTVTPSPARSQIRDDSALLDLGGSFWRENGLEEPHIQERPLTKKPSKKKLEIPKKDCPVPDDSAESWENWDTPEPNTKPERSNSDTSISDNQTSPSPNGTSPRTSVSSFRDGMQMPATHHDRSKRDSIPWPALTKLSPSNLRRTASHLMSDWEKSLTPPADEHGRLDYIGRAASPAGSGKDRKAD